MSCWNLRRYYVSWLGPQVNLLPNTFKLSGFPIFWLWSYLKVFQSFDCDHTWKFSNLLIVIILEGFQSFDCDHTWRFFNILIVIILEGFPILWLWSYLKVFQSFHCDHTWRFFNRLIVIILEGFPILWLWSYLKGFQLALIWQLFYLFCSSIVVNTVIVTAGNFEP